MTEHNPDLAMDDLPQNLEALDRALSALGDDVMTLSELDGLLAAVSACPEAIPPEEWLPLIWADQDVDEQALLSNPGVVEAVARILTRRMDIEAVLTAEDGAYEPLYSVDDRSGDVRWEVWLGGFQQGMALRVDAWEALYQRDVGAAEAFQLVTTLIFLAEGDPETKAELGPARTEELLSAAADVLPECVEVLARRARAGPRTPARSSKVGRNDPCSCGSGKKFKKCCGAA
jgi:uncharacterized protein